MNVRTSVAGTYLWYTKTGPVVYTVPNYNELALELPDLPLVGQAPHLGLRGNATDIIPLRFTWGIGKSKIFVDEPTEGKVSVEPQRVAHLLIDLGAFTVTSIAKGRSV